MLGDDTNSIYIDGWLPTIQKQTQVALRLRADAAEALDRGNRLTRFPFQAARTFDDIDALLSWYAAHVLELPTEGTVEISNAYGAVLYLADAQLDAIQMVEHRGVHLVMRYEFSGGEFSRTMP